MHGPPACGYVPALTNIYPSYEVSPLILFDNHLGDANSKIKEEYVKMAHILSFGTGRRRYVDNGGEHSPVGLWATISWSKPIK